MRPRIVILSVLEPLGERGLATEVRDAIDAGADVVPIATGVLDGGRLRRTPARTLEAALRGAFDAEVDGMLVGPLDGFWQSRVLARIFETALPSTLVFAPVGPGGDLPAARSWAIQSRAVLPIATTVILPGGAAGQLLLGRRDGEAEAAATAALDRGTHCAWITSDEDNRRLVDTIATGGHTSVIDYPSSDTSRSPAALLAAFLARGLPLREAIERAHRGARNLGEIAFAAQAG